MADPLRSDDPTRIGPYRLRARLGGGGMGQVYLGHSPGGFTVAVKVVRPELADDPDFRRRFAAEVGAARRVGGFYTAQVVDADPDAAPPWLATAYIPGPSLHRAVTDRGPLPLDSVAVLGAGLTEGLAAVHAQGIVHRDLKPANVLLAQDGPRVIDFGIARALDTTSHTRTSTVLGTAAFMSPEQARADGVGPASDVFSLACVLAFAATGLSPFGDGPPLAVLYRVVQQEPDLSGVPAPLVPVLRACLAKEPGSRPGLDDILPTLADLRPAAVPSDRGGWLPDDITEVLTLRATRILEQGCSGIVPDLHDQRRSALHARFLADVNALMARRRTRPGPPPAERPRSRPHPPPRQQGGRPETVDLTTPQGRVLSRIGNLLSGVAAALVVPAFLFVMGLMNLEGDPARALEAVQSTMAEASVWVFTSFLFLAGVFPPDAWKGRDLLVVDEDGISVIDKRWLRLEDRSFSLSWASLKRVELVPDGAFSLLVVRFGQGARPEKPKLQQHRVDGKPTSDYAVARLPMDRLGRSGVLPRLREALERFGGSAYRTATER